MAFKTSTTDTVINEYGSLIHKSFGSPQFPNIIDNETKIIAPDGDAFDNFGGSVAVGSGRIVVGANGDDDNGNNSGSAYIFDLDGNFITKITASDGYGGLPPAVGGDNFGNSVAVGSGRIVVGAYVNNDDGNASGSAYIFDFNGNELTKITASDGAELDNFGVSVAVGSGRIVVGAFRSDDNGNNSGSAYIFDLDGNELTKITASDGAANDQFGFSVAAGSGRIVVGARFNDDDGPGSGSAYIFDLDGNELAKITASDGNTFDNFGLSVAVGSGRIVVGAYLDDDNGSNSGSAYIYDLDGNFITKITASDGAADDFFGESVAVGSGRIIVGGALSDDTANGSRSGSAYIFDLDGNELAKITASDGAGADLFGKSVAVGSGRIVVGSNNDEDNEPGSGSAYIYKLQENYDIYIERQLGY